jgi:hypothetical protein
MNKLDDDKTEKCMCGYDVPAKDVVWINPATKARTWTEGLPYCEKCVPTTKEDL